MENMVIKQPKVKDLWRVKADLDDTSAVVTITGLEREILDPERIIVQYEYDMTRKTGSMYVDDFCNSFEFLDGPQRYSCQDCGETEGTILSVTCLSCNDPDCEHPTLNLCMYHLQERSTQAAIKSLLRGSGFQSVVVGSTQDLLKILGIPDDEPSGEES